MEKRALLEDFDFGLFEITNGSDGVKTIKLRILWKRNAVRLDIPVSLLAEPRQGHSVGITFSPVKGTECTYCFSQPEGEDQLGLNIHLCVIQADPDVQEFPRQDQQIFNGILQFRITSDTEWTWEIQNLNEDDSPLGDRTSLPMKFKDSDDEALTSAVDGILDLVAQEEPPPPDQK